MWFYFLWTCNSFTNPVIYYFTNKDFKIAFLSILMRKSRDDSTQGLNELSIPARNPTCLTNTH